MLIKMVRSYLDCNGDFKGCVHLLKLNKSYPLNECCLRYVNHTSVTNCVGSRANLLVFCVWSLTDFVIPQNLAIDVHTPIYSPWGVAGNGPVLEDRTGLAGPLGQANTSHCKQSDWKIPLNKQPCAFWNTEVMF